MPWIRETKALVHAYLGGQAGANAVLRVLTGEVNPSGRLAESYPVCYEDCPSARHFPGGEATVEYREGLFVGYRHYVTAGVDVLFPFGFGLSYTSFEYSDLRVTRAGIELKVMNTGDRPGKEVVQLYVGKYDSSIFRPSRELKGFTKVHVQPGERRHVTIPFDDKTFRHYDKASGDWETEPGTHQIMVGSSSNDIRLRGAVEISGRAPCGSYGRSEYPSYFSGKAADVPAAEFQRLLGREIPASDWQRGVDLGDTDSLDRCRYARGLFARFVRALVVGTYKLMWMIGKRTTANTIRTYFYAMPFRGVARMSGGAVNRSMVDGLLSIVNGRFGEGLRHTIRAYRRLKKEQS
jgi:beta-glucosidase